MYRGVGNLQGLGIDVPFTTDRGMPGLENVHPSASAQPSPCGSPHGVQQMLKDLGYYAGPVDGNFTGPSNAALGDFASAAGVRLAGHVTDELCQALITAWEPWLMTGQSPLSAASVRMRAQILRAPTGMSTTTAPTFPRMPGAFRPAPEGEPGIQPTAPGGTSWWAQASGAKKAAVVGGAVLVVGGVAMAMRKKKRKRA